MNILITCPPMLRCRDQFLPLLEDLGATATCPDVVQTLTEAELESLLPEHDGWIIGDDPATYRVLSAGCKGKLKAAVKWGAGTDNVDFTACKELGLPVTNTPGMFGNEVADLAVGYVVGLARQTFLIDRGIRTGEWPKPQGMSLQGKTAGIVGYGHIGRALLQRLVAFDMNVQVYDPYATGTAHQDVIKDWPSDLHQCDFLIFTCALTTDNIHMLNTDTLGLCKDGVRIVNVARGKLIDEEALISALETGRVHSAALDVFEQEPLSNDSRLLQYPDCILGSHNASNTREAVDRTNREAIHRLFNLLSGSQK